jgi:hypothetical protein
VALSALSDAAGRSPSGLPELAALANDGAADATHRVRAIEILADAADTSDRDGLKAVQTQARKHWETVCSPILKTHDVDDYFKALPQRQQLYRRRRRRTRAPGRRLAGVEHLCRRQGGLPRQPRIDVGQSRTRGSGRARRTRSCRCAGRAGRRGGARAHRAGLARTRCARCEPWRVDGRAGSRDGRREIEWQGRRRRIVVCGDREGRCRDRQETRELGQRDAAGAVSADAGHAAGADRRCGELLRHPAGGGRTRGHRQVSGRPWRERGRDHARRHAPAGTRRNTPVRPRSWRCWRADHGSSHLP